MLKERNQLEIQKKLQDEMKRRGLDALVLTSPETVYYATGYASAFLFFTRSQGYTMAVVPAEGPCEIVVMEMERGTVSMQCKDVKCNTYPVWIYLDDVEDDGKEKPAQPNLNAPFDIVVEIIRSKKTNPKVGMETEILPVPRYEYACSVFGKENVVDCEPMLRKVRAIKTKWEIDTLRKAAQYAEKAMFETSRVVQVGWSEAEVLAAFREACFRQGLEVMAHNCVPSIGSGYAPMVIARDVTLKSGDIVRLDGGPIIDCYVSDICRTFIIGEARKPQEELYALLKKAHDREMEIIGPGVKMSDVFKEVMSVFHKSGATKYKRGHFGHSVGCNKFVEEYPFIAPDNDDVLEPGMVMCIETPYYSGANGGFNMEDEVVITENGFERFTTVNEDLYWGRR